MNRRRNIGCGRSSGQSIVYARSTRGWDDISCSADAFQAVIIVALLRGKPLKTIWARPLETTRRRILDTRFLGDVMMISWEVAEDVVTVVANQWLRLLRSTPSSTYNWHWRWTAVYLRRWEIWASAERQITLSILFSKQGIHARQRRRYAHSHSHPHPIVGMEWGLGLRMRLRMRLGLRVLL